MGVLNHSLSILLITMWNTLQNHTLEQPIHHPTKINVLNIDHAPKVGPHQHLLSLAPSKYS